MLAGDAGVIDFSRFDEPPELPTGRFAPMLSVSKEAANLSRTHEVYLLLLLFGHADDCSWVSAAQLDPGP